MRVIIIDNAKNLMYRAAASCAECVQWHGLAGRSRLPYTAAWCVYLSTDLRSRRHEPASRCLAGEAAGTV